MGILGMVAAGAAEAGGKATSELASKLTLQQEEAAIQAARDARLHENAKGLQATQITSTEGIHARAEEGMGTRQGAQITSTEGIAARGILSHENISANQLASNEKIHAAAIKSSEKIAGMSNAIASGQLDLAKVRDKIDNDLKNITLGNAKQVEDLRKEYVKPGVPSARKQEIHDTIQLLTGKDNDNIVPLPEKDALGNVTYSKALDKKSGKVISLVEATNGSGGPPVGTVDQGRRFTGGDYRKPENWVPVTPSVPRLPDLEEPPGTPREAVPVEGLLSRKKRELAEAADKIAARKAEYGDSLY